MWHNYIHANDDTTKRGSALVMAIIFIFGLTVIGSIISMIASVDLRISGNQKLNTRALYAAEAGLNEAVHRLSLPNPTVSTVNGWTGNVALSDTPPYDPDWTARIYMTDPGSAPASNGSNVNTGTLQDTGGDYLDYSQANGVEDVLTIEHKWEDLDNDGIRDANEIVLYDGAQAPPENFASGWPIEVISVTANSGQGIRRVEAEVTRLPLVGRTLGALYIDKAIRVNGTPAFCGYNHDFNTPIGTAPMGCFTYHLGSGHLPGITTTGDDVDFQGNAWDCLGSPAATDTSAANPFFSLAEVLGLTQSQTNQLLANAHNTSITSPLDGITYIQGNVHINSNLTGEGLIYITGNLSANGGFDYKGLIYVEGDLTFNGSPWILGSVIVNGTGDFNFAAGGAELLYSRDAIQIGVGQFLPMMRLSWREQ